ncbi:MAG: ABC transporter substrate-binding protein [Gemmatimonadales bacterium]|nr:ABC transporter substrate-binding protein [Gemmatimonadales bacterium]
MVAAAHRLARRPFALALLAFAAACGGAKTDDAAKAAAGAPATTPKAIHIIRAADWIGNEWSEDALRVGLLEAGLERGTDYEFKVSSAQGDLAALPALIDAAIDAKADVIVTLQDATLQAAVQRVKDRPIVFHVLADPFAAGAGTSDSAHLPNITGVYSPGFGDPEQTRRIELIRRVVPKAKKLGILFTPGEPLAVSLKDKLAEAAKQAGLAVEAVPVNAVSEGTQAATALVDRKVDAIEIFGNAAHGAFESIITVAKAKKVPVFSPSPFEIMKGATAALYPDFQEGGAVAGGMIGKILKGTSPAAIPFYRLEKTKTDTAATAKQ